MLKRVTGSINYFYVYLTNFFIRNYDLKIRKHQDLFIKKIYV